jgi:hypothetical protein
MTGAPSAALGQLMLMRPSHKMQLSYNTRWIDDCQQSEYCMAEVVSVANPKPFSRTTKNTNREAKAGRHFQTIASKPSESATISADQRF